MLIAFGDIHGQLQKLISLLEQCRRLDSAEKAEYVFLGDYIDRGPDSSGVVELLISLQAELPGSVRTLMGNHEELVLSALQSDVFLDAWLDNDGGTTLKSYGVSSVHDIPEPHLRWFKSLLTHYDDGRRFFAHAGIRPGVPLAQQDVRDLLWIRKPFLESEADHGRLIVHGHTPTKDRAPEVRRNRIDLDTGAGHGGPLTAAVFNDEPQDIIFLRSL
jgi:serine/threonine protein phosphatase 1